MTSVIIAAHNEEDVIGDCLDALAAARGATPLQIIVCANGCSDRTAQVASEHGATVIDRVEPGKSDAINAAEALATSFPRIYLDADIMVPDDGVQRLVEALSARPEVLAVAPSRTVDTRGRSVVVRAYFAISTRLPAFGDGLFGRGMIVLSEAGRARFDRFPTLIADDLYLDSLFGPGEKHILTSVRVTVEAPYRTTDLVNRLVRVRRGNAQLRAAASAGRIDASVRTSDKWSWLRNVVAPKPYLVFAAVPYVIVTVLAGSLARSRKRTGWGRDSSTRNTRPGGVRAGR